jgi:hypothetical protein
MTDLVYTDNDSIHIATKELIIGKAYPITFKGIKYVVFKPKEGIIDFYELEKEGEIK